MPNSYAETVRLLAEANAVLEDAHIDAMAISMDLTHKDVMQGLAANEAEWERLKQAPELRTSCFQGTTHE